MTHVNAYRRDTGEKVRVPESHLRIFPEALSKTPRQKATDKAATAATTQAAGAAKKKEDA